MKVKMLSILIITYIHLFNFTLLGNCFVQEINSTIAGIVSDEYGAVIADAEIDLIDSISKSTIKVKTNQFGEYEIKNIKPGKYYLIALAFLTFETTEQIIINNNNHHTFNIVIPVEHCEGLAKPLNIQRFNKTKCQIHDIPLEKDIVEIDYGEIIISDDYLIALNNKFPNSYITYFGGCLVSCYKKAEVLFCKRCRIEEKEWTKANNKKVDASNN